VDVEVALPAYGCAPYVDACLESVTSQLGQLGQFGAARIVSRDDASKDDTAAKLSAWQDKLGPARMTLLDGPAGNLGVIGNYNAVLSATRAPYVMTADPDDVWLPGKAEQTLAAMREATTRWGDRTPIAVCTDAEVVDAAGQPVAPSFWQWSRMAPDAPMTTRRVAMESVALGSTMVVNRALLDLALPIAQGAMYQDWWLALVAAAFGRLVALPRRTVAYRRHDANSTGAPYSASLRSALRRALRDPEGPRRRLRLVLGHASRQAGAFVARFGHRLPAGDAAALRALAALPTSAPLARRAALVRHGLWFGQPLKNVGLFAMV
jgi:glycosyltransferase involved in cell wall biosynthesis